MAGLARPTLRCLREDLALAVPRADTPLEGNQPPAPGQGHRALHRRPDAARTGRLWVRAARPHPRV